MPVYKDVRYNTWFTAFYYIDWQGKRVKKMNDIKATDVMAWQNAMINYRDSKGKGYSMTYMKTQHNKHQ